jgi:tRNA (adenine22-N1)-methyltransferase
LKIGSRLQALEKMIKRPYEHIWDCCCDHGLLGMRLLQSHQTGMIHFVDIVVPLINQLEIKLQQYFYNENDLSRWKTYCQDISSLALEESDSQLIIVAGVGGDKVIEFVRALVKNNKNHKHEYLLCPVHHNYRVRNALKTMGFGLINEVLVKENKRFYELIHVSMQSTTELSSVGSKMWDFTRNDDNEYCNQTINYYQSKSRDKTNAVSDILAAYQALRP